MKLAGFGWMEFALRYRYCRRNLYNHPVNYNKENIR